MSCLAFFELLDRALLNQTENCSFLFNSPSATKTIFFSDLMTFHGQLNKGLFHFISWLIESNDREIYLCKHCCIKFHHSKNDIELLKVTLSSKSRCRLHFDKGSEEWTEKCWIQWNNRCMKFTASILNKENKKQESAEEEIDTTKKLQPESIVQLSRNAGRQTLSIFFNGQSPPSKEELVTPSLSPTRSRREDSDDNSVSKGRRFSFTSLRQTLSGSKLLSSPQQPQQTSDMSSNIDSISSSSTVNPTIMSAVDNTDQITVQSKTTIDTEGSMKSSSGDTDKCIEQEPTTTTTTSNGQDSLKEFNSSNCGYIIDCAKNSSSNRCSRDEAVLVNRALGIDINGDEDDGIDDEDDIQRRITDPEIQTLIFGNNLIIEPHSKGLSAASSPSSSASAASSSSISTASTADNTGAAATSPSPSHLTSSSTAMMVMSDKVHSREKSPCAYDGADSVNDDDDNRSHVTSSTGTRGPRMASLSSLPEDTAKLAALFMIKSHSVFDGEYLGKRASTDLIFKNRFFWICPSTRSIHWMKSQEHKWDPSHSKYILLRQSKVASASGSSFSVSSSMTSNNNIAKKARGNCIGVLIRVEFGPNSLRIHTRDGLYIELKVPTETVACWRKTILSLI